MGDTTGQYLGGGHGRTWAGVVQSPGPQLPAGPYHTHVSSCRGMYVKSYIRSWVCVCVYIGGGHGFTRSRSNNTLTPMAAQVYVLGCNHDFFWGAGMKLKFVARNFISNISLLSITVHLKYTDTDSFGGA